MRVRRSLLWVNGYDAEKLKEGIRAVHAKGGHVTLYYQGHLMDVGSKFYKEKGFLNKPKSCKACRDAKKNAGRGERQYFITTCAQCGGEAKVTFQPSSDRPVYCSACFEARKNAQ